MKIATWNVNSLRVRLSQVIIWLKANPVAVLGLQETKLCDEQFPSAAFEAIGYHSLFSGQKTYNGVALIVHNRYRYSIDKSTILYNLRGFEDQQRLIAATIHGIRIICAYFPNGQALDSEKFVYKLRWMEALRDWLAEEMVHQLQLVLLGDFNIAPEDRDVYDPSAWVGQNLVSPAERAAFAQLTALGLTDVFRQFGQADQAYTWWDYRKGAFRRNAGLRLDHILLSPQLAQACSNCAIDKTPRSWTQPSDHVPVITEIKEIATL